MGYVVIRGGIWVRLAGMCECRMIATYPEAWLAGVGELDGSTEAAAGRHVGRIFGNFERRQMQRGIDRGIAAPTRALYSLNRYVDSI